MRFSGKVGFAKVVETEPSVWEEVIVERPYKGDYVRDSRRYDTPTQVVDNLTRSDEILIVADSYMRKNSGFMRYVEIDGIKWAISYIENKRPRIRLTLGGVYNHES